VGGIIRDAAYGIVFYGVPGESGSNIGCLVADYDETVRRFSDGELLLAGAYSLRV
jgi:hypothetical protein